LQISNKFRLAEAQRIILWESCQSPHTAFLINEIGTLLPNVHVMCCTQEGILEDRSQLGWSLDCESLAVNYVINPSIKDIDEIFAAELNTIHIITSIRHIPFMKYVIRQLKSSNAFFGIYAETRGYTGINGILRKSQSLIEEFWFKKNASFILGIGDLGYNWFKSVGYSSSKIFKFAYFLPPPKFMDLEHSNGVRDTISIGYVGRIIRPKGVMLLPEIIKFIESSVRFTVVGQGSMLSELKKRLLHNDNVSFKGVIPNKEISTFMRTLDLLILPSIDKDGWGAVVSEALMVGTPVIASSNVGASFLLKDPLMGEVILKNDPVTIARQIDQMRLKGLFDQSHRLERKIKAQGLLSSEVGAKYFVEIMRHILDHGPRPTLFP